MEHSELMSVHNQDIEESPIYGQWSMMLPDSSKS